MTSFYLSAKHMPTSASKTTTRMKTFLRIPTRAIPGRISVSSSDGGDLVYDSLKGAHTHNVEFQISLLVS